MTVIFARLFVFSFFYFRFAREPSVVRIDHTKRKDDKFLRRNRKTIVALNFRRIFSRDYFRISAFLEATNVENLPCEIRLLLIMPHVMR